VSVSDPDMGTPWAQSGPTAGLADLLRAAREGDTSAWDNIVRRYGGLVRAVARSFRLQHADVCDVVQMTWLRLAENCARIEKPESLGAWLMTTARRESLRIARRARQVPIGDVEPTTDARDRAAGPDEQVIGAETARSVRALLEELPPRWRTLLYALYIDLPRSYSEITDTVGIPTGSIGPTRTRALRRLRCLIEERGLDMAASGGG
jgi:RNA polymerase sigma factor (sigma-70 family)